ncbi:hypothetical protein H8F21_15915 [Pseudomonas sp. P66]|uniref:Lipoprotein n=1 Tax=Pseudomonas arcuscaelestis TaxID=2710591 RepID=A0ABS2C012_9PSED|nr:hypothetical protein [Pseudomonas arcuscaelestis]MBM5459055.1 hypothetical protein [Pseudomonas arcuscaelestis]
MSADAIGKAVWVVGAVIASACATGTTMHYFNRDNVRKAKEAGNREGAAQEKARQEESRQRSNAATAAVLAKYAESQKMYRLALALASVGAACAASFGPLSPDDKANIEEFTLGVSRAALPGHVRSRMEKVMSTPIDVKTAYAVASKDLAPDHWKLFDEMVDLVVSLKIQVQGMRPTSFGSEWHYLRAVA